MINTTGQTLVLNEANQDTLINCAQQCPYYYGNAVYQARLLLSFFDTTQYYNECELPVYQDGQKVNPNTIENTLKNYFNVYPNPANEMITVENLTGNSAIIEIYNYLGTKICSYKINKSVNFISLKELACGLYIYRISQNNNTIKSDKLIVIK